MAVEKRTTIEITEQGVCSITSNIKKHKNRIKKLNKEHPDETYLSELEDYNLYMTFPYSWVKLPHPPSRTREWTEEEKEQLRIRLKKYHAKKKGTQE